MTKYRSLYYEIIIQNPVYKKLLLKHTGYNKSKKRSVQQLIDDELIDIHMEKEIYRALNKATVFGMCKCKRTCYSHACVKATSLIDTCDESMLNWLNGEI